MHTENHNPLFIISLLGALSVITPFSIDMYLPAFQQMAHEFHTSSAIVSLSLSSYFIGLAMGQIIYGPLLDRFGRKKPLYIGLSVFIMASAACSVAPTIHIFIALRFLQAIGGCAAAVASLAMVRDFFSPQDSAKVFSRLFLFIGVSPLLAPTIGGMIVAAYGWKIIFLILALITFLILSLIFLKLPEAHTPDPTISLKPAPIIKEFISILKKPRFIVYALSGAFSFAGLFAYLAGAPIVFMEGYHVSAPVFGRIFAGLAMGFIGANQVNAYILRRYSSQFIYTRAVIAQTVTALFFMVCTFNGLLGFYPTLLFFFIFLCCTGFTYPNAAALALEPFTKNVGSASALMGFLQMGIGALMSTTISAAAFQGSDMVIASLAGTATIGMVILFAGYEKAKNVAPE